MTGAAIWLQRGAPPEKQIAVCLEYSRTSGYRVATLAPIHGAVDLVKLVDRRIVTVVVVPFASRAAVALATDLAGAGRVESVRPRPQVIQPPPQRLAQQVELVLRWHHRGKGPAEIAELLDVAADDIRGLLRQNGVQLPNPSGRAR